MMADEVPSESVIRAFCEYLQRIDAGEVPNRQAFLAEFPDQADALAPQLQLEEALRSPPASTSPDMPEEVATVINRRNNAIAETINYAEASTSPQQNQTEELGIPRSFGRYRVERLLGAGAMGAVYLAHDLHLDRDVALKIPRFNHQREKELLARFYREARAVATVRHPGICPVYDVGEIAGHTFLSMAYIQGRPLVDYTRSGCTQASPAVARLIMQLALALQETHDAGVVHRDLKPANIMIGPRGEPVVMDFGLARRLDSDDARITGSGDIIGTPAYMSPEQVTGHADSVGPASDQYSLGVILYELLTGQLPFQGTVLSIIGQIAHTDPKPVHEHRADAARELAAICSRMMARQASDRYPDMSAAAAALNDYSTAAALLPDYKNQSIWNTDLP